MREIFEAINDYPWTTFFVWIMLLVLVYEFKSNKE